jgi:hypothetical protein
MDIYWNILVFTMHGPMNVKFPNNTSKWQMENNSAFKGLIEGAGTVRCMKAQGSGYSGLVVSMLASGTQVCGFKPEKILSMPSFGGEVKPSVPCRSFTACKRSLNVKWKISI